MKRFKRIGLFVCFVLAVFTAKGQTAKALFDSIPDNMLPLLTSVNRADFIDFLDSKMKAVVRNKMGENSEMTTLTPDYIRIALTSRTTWQMKVLPTDKDSVICVIATACAPACDSNIRFYSTQWKELPVADYITLPQADDFFKIPADSLLMNDYIAFRNRAKLFLCTGNCSGDDARLVFRFTTPDYLADTTEKEKTFYRDTIIYRWNGKRFERM
jgi:hypothetical protein